MTVPSNNSDVESKPSGDKTKNTLAEDKLSEEDRQLMDTLSMIVQRIIEQDANEELRLNALNALREQIRTTTTSISSIPKALKFLLLHYRVLKSTYQILNAALPSSLHLAHILAVLAMTFEDDEKLAGNRESLHYQLAAAPLNEPIDSWGHEYVKYLAKEIGEEFRELGKIDHLLSLISQILQFFLKHNAEPDACDLLIEVDRIESLIEAVKAEGDLLDYARVCRYLASCVPFEPFPADHRVLKVILAIYLDRHDFPWALVIALRLNSIDHLKQVFSASQGNHVMQRQLAFMLARQRVAIDGIGSDGREKDALLDIMFNAKLSQHYLELAKELQILDPRDPEEIFKSTQSNDPLRIVPKAETAKSNLATIIANALLNAGYCQDKLLSNDQEQFLWKNKDHALMTAAASLGAVHMWNLGEGLGRLDALYNQNQGSTNPQAPFVQAGALLGIGLIHSGIRNEADTAFALLREPLDSSQDLTLRIGAILGLAFAYGGTGRRDVSAALLSLISDPELQVSVFAALAVGNIFVGNADGDASSAILQAMMERDALDLNKPVARFYSLGLALLYYGQPEAAEAVLETLSVIEQHPIGRDTQVLIKGIAYAGSGNINRIHELLGVLQQYNLERKQKEDKQRAEEKAKAENRANPESPQPQEIFESLGAVYAVMGMALISITEEIGQEMALRMFNHVMHYGDAAVRRVVPLAIGLLYSSHPTLPVMDTLSKFSHDHDKSIACNAIISMGLVAAGTNHAKMAQLLRQLTLYYARDPDCLLAIRVAQGLVHMGKGTLSLSPIRMQRMLVSPAGLAGLLSGLMGWTAPDAFILSNHPYLIFFFLYAATPRFLITLDKDTLAAISVPVRVGQAVDTVGQAGKPRTITGFQTHSTPVVVGYTEQAELATDEYYTFSPILEGFVLVEKTNMD